MPVPVSFTPSHRGGHGTPLILLHGFTDTWRTWELVLDALERRHDVLAPTLAGHAGGPELDGDPVGAMLDGVERAMDQAGFDTAHLVGNSLGGYLALHLAGRGRARSVVALAPAGGWAPGDPDEAETLRYFAPMQAQVRELLPHADAVLATVEGRRLATRATVVDPAHLPVELLVHQMGGVAACAGLQATADQALRDGFALDPERIACPVRVVWGLEDQLLPWPTAAARYRHEWLPQAEWVELDGVGHCPQLDVPLQTAELILGFTAG